MFHGSNPSTDLKWSDLSDFSVADVGAQAVFALDDMVALFPPLPLPLLHLFFVSSRSLLFSFPLSPLPFFPSFLPLSPLTSRMFSIC